MKDIITISTGNVLPSMTTGLPACLTSNHFAQAQMILTIFWEEELRLVPSLRFLVNSEQEKHSYATLCVLLHKDH